MAWYDDGVLDREDALAIAKHLDRPRKMFGVSVQIKDMHWDASKKERVHVGYKDASVWQCSLSLRAEEGALTDQQWGKGNQGPRDVAVTVGFEPIVTRPFLRSPHTPWQCNRGEALVEIP